MGPSPHACILRALRRARPPLWVTTVGALLAVVTFALLICAAATGRYSPVVAVVFFVGLAFGIAIDLWAVAKIGGWAR